MEFVFDSDGIAILPHSPSSRDTWDYLSSVRDAKIGVFDSSLNPPHCGHLEMVIQSILSMEFHAIILQISVKNAEKKVSILIDLPFFKTFG